MSPDAAGNFKPISVPARAWERIFGPPEWACPAWPVCNSSDCPTAADDDVCLPHEYERFLADAKR